MRASFLLLPFLAGAGLAQTVRLPEFAVTLEKGASPETIEAQFLRAIENPGEGLARGLPIDLALRQAPEFSLFRRGSSLDLNPTAQGVSLRGIGPSGASRSLVLWDGVPLNDGFGGWVNWTKVSQARLARLEIAPSGAATSWGNAALSGALAFVPRTPRPGEIQLDAMAGSFHTWSLEGSLSVAAAGTLTLEGARISRDGAIPVRADQRGVVDQPSSLRVERAGASWKSHATAAGVFSLQARTFSEQRGNGTAGQRNGSRERFASGRWNSPANRAWVQDFAAYVQGQSYRSTFTSVAVDRSRETPASEQYEVPATAVGAAWSARSDARDRWSGAFGIDTRRVSGETRELFSFSNGRFTRARWAGGTQEFLGGYAQARTRLADWSLTASLREDVWAESSGHRRETDTASNAVLRNDAFPRRSGNETSPRLSLARAWSPAFSTHLEAYRRFRRPTLNELYRPFRQGSDQTEANPLLSTESLRGLELGLSGRADKVSWRSQAFLATLYDAVANVTVARGPGTYPDFGFIPAGGTGRKRLNLDRIDVRGLQSEVSWAATPALQLQAGWLWTNSTIGAASVSPTLVGRTPPQTPAHTVTTQATWRPTSRWSLSAQGRWSDRQFEDDENRLALPAAAVLDLSATRNISAELQLSGGVRNLAGAEVETSRSSTGLVTLGQPREFWLAVSWRR